MCQTIEVSVLDIGRNEDAKRISLGINSGGFTASIGGVNENIFNVNAVSSNTSDWQHIVLSWSGTNYARIYINGSQSAETTSILSGTLTLESGDPFYLGKRYSGSNYFPGDMYEVAIWNDA